MAQTVEQALVRVDLNTDTGESFGQWKMGDEEALLSHVTSANVACGMHAGDPMVMARMTRLCAEKGVAAGAHPGFPDLQGFGRREMRMSPLEIETFVMYQIGALKVFTHDAGLRMTHVKPHGTLYNMSAVDEGIAFAIARAVARSSGPGEAIILVGLAGSLSLDAARKAGVPCASEAFCDRTYNRDGTLMDRRLPGAVLHDPDSIARRAVIMATSKVVVLDDGTTLERATDTLCVHGDTPGASEIASAVRRALEEAGVAVRPLTGSGKL